MREVSTFDLAVIGAGPGGTATAITAARLGAKVALFEAGQFPRHKVCGEFVSAESLHILRDLLRNTPGAEHVLGAAPVIGETRLWFRGRSIRTDVDPPGLSIPRCDLDCLLWSAAQKAGARAMDNCEVQSIEGESPFRVTSNRATIAAAAIVIAAGRWSRFTAQVNRPDGPKWLGVKAHFRESKPPLSSDLYFFDGGYCGVQPVGENLVNACAMLRADRAKTLAEALELDPALANRSRNWQAATDTVTTAPLIYREPAPVIGNLMFVGDAAAFIDPFVGDGISIALHTGTLAAKTLKSSARGSLSLASALEAYRSTYEKQFTSSIITASRIRQLLFWPRPLQIAVFELLRAPGVLPHLIRKTRQAVPVV